MKITSKGQVTIPVEIRERLGFLPYTEVVFEVEGETLRLRKAPRTNRRGKELIAQMRGKATAGMSTEEIMELTRSE